MMKKNVLAMGLALTMAPWADRLRQQLQRLRQLRRGLRLRQPE